MPQHLDTQDPARGCRSAPPTWDKRPEPDSPQAGVLRDPGEGSLPKEMSPNAQTKTALGKVGPTGISRRRVEQHLGLSDRPSRRRALRVAANFSRELLSNLLEVGARGQRRGQGQRREAGLAPAASAYRPVYLLMYPSPSPSQVWKRRRIRSSSPVLDVSLLLLPAPPLLPPLALPAAAAIMRPLPAREEEDAPQPEEPVRLQSSSQLRTCLTTEHAQWPPGRSGRGIPPLRVLPGLGRWALCNRRSRHLRRGRCSWSQGGKDGDEDVRGHRIHRRGPGKVSAASIRTLRSRGRFGQMAGVLPAERSREFLFQEQNKHYSFCRLKAVLRSHSENCVGFCTHSSQMRLGLAGLCMRCLRLSKKKKKI